MSDQALEPTVPLQDISHLESLARDFECAFTNGENARVEDFLGNIQEGLRQLALQLLLATEIRLRKTRHEAIDQREYLLRFPGFEQVVLGTFKSFGAIDGVVDPTKELPPDGLHIRCPHCHNPVKLVPDARLDSIQCFACGSDFSLVSDATDATRDNRSFVKVAHFKLVERLGMGSFGAVWKAHDTELDRTVAIKLPRSGQMQGQHEEVFLREARTAARLRHPHIVPVYEVGRDSETLYIVSEFIRGAPLSDWLTTQQPTQKESVILCEKIAAALHHAHEHGVIHRDLKPGNIMMGFDNEPFLTDFGLARREAGEITMTLEGQVLGTPGYMSPEQAQGDSHSADRRSDVYSMGVLLYQLLTGELPFRGNVRMLIHQVINEEAPSPRSLNSNISKDLETITLKCLEKEPDNRFATAELFRQELLRFLQGEPILSRPISSFSRGWRWSKRNRSVAVLLMGIATALLMGTIVSSYFAIQASEALQIVDQERATAEMRLTRSLAAEGLASQESSPPQYIKARTSFWNAFDLLKKNGKSTLPVSFSLANNYFASSPAMNHIRVEDADLQRLAISPDDRCIAVASLEGQVYLFELLTGRRWPRPLESKILGVAVAFNPAGDELLTGDAKGMLRLWRFPSGELIHKWQAHRTTIHDCCFTGDGTKIVSLAPRIVPSSIDSEVKLWDVETRKQLGSAEKTTGSTVSVAREENRLCAGAKVFNFDHGGLQLMWSAEESLKNQNVKSSALSHDGSEVFLGDHNGNLWYHVLPNLLDPFHEPMLNPFSHNAMVSTICYSPSDRKVLAASTGNSMTVGVTGSLFDSQSQSWQKSLMDAMFRKWSFSMQGSEHRGAIQDAEWLSDGKSYVSCASDGSICLYADDASSPYRTIEHEEFQTLENAPQGPALFSLENRAVLYQGPEQGIIWDVATLKPILRFIIKQSKGEEFSRDIIAVHEKLSAWVITPYELARWDMLANEITARIPLTGKAVVRDSPRLNRGTYYGEPMAYAISADHTRFAEATPEGVVIWDLETQNQIGLLPVEHSHYVTIALSPKGTKLAVSDGTYLLSLWDVASRKVLKSAKTTPFGEYTSMWIGSPPQLKWSPAEDRIFVSHHQKDSVVMWDISTNQIKVVAKHAGGINGVVPSCDGESVVTYGSDGQILCNLADGSIEPVSTRNLYPRFASLAANDDNLAMTFPGRVHLIDLSSLGRLRNANVVNNSTLLRTIGEEYAFRGAWSWATQVLAKAREEGEEVSPLTMARCYWMTGDLLKAKSEFKRALANRQAPAQYLKLCLQGCDAPTLIQFPESPLLGRAYNLVTRGKHAEAEKLLSQCLAEGVISNDYWKQAKTLISNSSKEYQASIEPIDDAFRPKEIIPWTKANQAIGQKVCVEGKVLVASNIGTVCFLNFAKDWRGKLTIEIHGDTFSDFEIAPDALFPEKVVRVTGVVTLYKGQPRIEVSDAAQIKIVSAEKVSID